MNAEEFLKKCGEWNERNAVFLANMDAWHARRMSGVGGSEIATIMGENPWHTAHELWLQKTGKMPAFEGNNATLMGHILEPAVASWYERETLNIVEVDETHYRSEDAPWLCGNIDRRIVGGGILECKTSDTHDPFSDGWGDGNQYHPVTRELVVEDHKIPRHYELQVRLYMLVTGAPWADLAVIFKSLKTGEPFRVYRIYPDAGDTAAMIKAGHDFMEMVFNDIEPPMSAAEIAEAHAKNQSIASAVDVDGEIVERLVEVKSQIKILEDEEKALSDQIKATLRNSETGMVLGRPAVTWKSQTRKSFDEVRFRDECPDVWAKYQREIVMRCFRIRSKKGK